MELPILTRVYYAAFALLLASIAILTITLSLLVMEIKEEVEAIHIILTTDYEITQ